MLKPFLLFVLLFCGYISHTQNTIGIPNISNYTRETYNAGSQNWSIAQDKKGIMYFANSKGMLCFDGAFWRTYSLPNKTIVRSLAIGDDGKIYAGGQAEFGYFSAGVKGELHYTSLDSLLPKNNREFADVWNISIWKGHIFFRTNYHIFEFDGRQLKAHPSNLWAFSGVAGDQLVGFNREYGLVTLDNSVWRPGIKVGQLPPDVLIKAVVDLGNDSLLLVSLVHGLYVLRHDTLSRFETPAITAAASKNIFACTLLNAGKIALITNLGGCIVINRQGEFVQRITRQEGMQNNNILSALLDRDQNLWLGLDNGIDLVNYSNAIKNIFPDQVDRNAGYASLVSDHQLYLGVSTGAYSIPLEPAADLSYTKGTFKFIEHSKGQVYSFASLGGKVLMSHNKGAFEINNYTAESLDASTGYWKFLSLQGQEKALAIAGTYNGINFYDQQKGNYRDPVYLSKFESARFIVICKGVIWVAHPYRGIYKLIFNQNQHPVATLYQDKKGILSGNHNKIFSINGKVILTTDNGIFEYDDQAGDFVHAKEFEQLFGKTVSYLQEDQYGNIWFARDKKMGVLEKKQGKWSLIYIPELDDRILASGFENINVVDSNNVFIAAEKGFFHINYAQYRKTRYPMRALIRLVGTNSQNDGLLYAGFAADPGKIAIPEIDYTYNNLHFEYASTYYGQEKNTSFSYMLQGFDKNWSEWQKKTEKDYTNLPAGKYVFLVKCRNNIDNESPIARYSFTVLPPWYQTWWAYILYGILLFALLYVFYKRQQRKYKRQAQAKLEEQQRKYREEQQQQKVLHELEIEKNEKQIVELTNEKLQAEIKHKNSELASSAMNLVRKMEIFSKLKTDLHEYKSQSDAKNGHKEFQKIIKTIENEIDHNEEWEQFVQHFDSVHTDYLKKLKEYCPGLTATELKLAAYLRLNLSTKEIAQLLNISVRGVETSRYRLRKKLGLVSNEASLFDHLIEITS